MCLGYWTTLYPLAPPYIKWGTATLSPLVMKTAGVCSKSSSSTDQPRWGGSWHNPCSAVLLTELGFLLSFIDRSAVCYSLALLWWYVSRGTGLLGPGYVSGRAAQACQAGAVGISLAGHGLSCLPCSVLPEELSLALLALIRSSHFIDFFTFCNFLN